MNFATFFSNQARKPSGLFGRFVAALIFISVNTAYFWPRPEATIAKMAGLLKPAGRLAIGFHAKADMQDAKRNRDIFRFYSPRDMEALLDGCGAFKNVDVVAGKGKTKPLYGAFGTT